MERDMTKTTSRWSTESRHARGYGSGWDRLRLSILARDCHICQCPECLGGQKAVRVATHVDHIKPKAHGGTDDPANLRAVNAECHKRLTMEQQGKRLREVTRFDRNGRVVW
jgi:5-methylcytosine-specific restriction enzyme A